MESGHMVPTLKPFSLRVHDNQQMILVAGDQEAVVNLPGAVSWQHLNFLPHWHVLVSADFSNDGLNDLILVITANGVYGFVQTRQPGALFFSTLVGCLIIVMGVMFVTQHLNSMNGKPRTSRWLLKMWSCNLRKDCCCTLQRYFCLGTGVSIYHLQGKCHSSGWSTED